MKCPVCQHEHDLPPPRLLSVVNLNDSRVETWGWYESDLIKGARGVEVTKTHVETKEDAAA